MTDFVVKVIFLLLQRSKNHTNYNNCRSVHLAIYLHTFKDPCLRCPGIYDYCSCPEKLHSHLAAWFWTPQSSIWFAVYWSFCTTPCSRVWGTSRFLGRGNVFEVLQDGVRVREQTKFLINRRGWRTGESYFVAYYHGHELGQQLPTTWCFIARLVLHLKSMYFYKKPTQ